MTSRAALSFHELIHCSLENKLKSKKKKNHLGYHVYSSHLFFLWQLSVWLPAKRKRLPTAITLNYSWYRIAAFPSVGEGSCNFMICTGKWSYLLCLFINCVLCGWLANLGGFTTTNKKTHQKSNYFPSVTYRAKIPLPEHLHLQMNLEHGSGDWDLFCCLTSFKTEIHIGSSDWKTSQIQDLLWHRWW